MALKHFAIEIKQDAATPIKEVDINFLNSQTPIPGKELFAETQGLVEAIEEANKRGIKVNIIIGKERFDENNFDD
jgi:hypothetical protein